MLWTIIITAYYIVSALLTLTMLVVLILCGIKYLKK